MKNIHTKQVYHVDTDMSHLLLKMIHRSFKKISHTKDSNHYPSMILHSLNYLQVMASYQSIWSRRNRRRWWCNWMGEDALSHGIDQPMGKESDRFCLVIMKDVMYMTLIAISNWWYNRDSMCFCFKWSIIKRRLV